VNNPASKREIIQRNYEQVIDRIHKAARAAGRDPATIRLVVVTKTHPLEVVQAVIEAGATDLGENYVEEAIPKIEAMARHTSIHWHMIGHVQSRKAEKVCEYFQYVHSVDSAKLAERLSRFEVERTQRLPIWLEFNTGNEETKSGWNIAQREDWANILPEIEKIISLPGLRLMGVMTIPPYSSNPEDSRSYYRKLKEFQRYLIERFKILDFTELSMGMSGDYEVAIQEGSTWLRIGQAILGPRPG